MANSAVSGNGCASAPFLERLSRLMALTSWCLLRECCRPALGPWGADRYHQPTHRFPTVWLVLAARKHRWVRVSAPQMFRHIPTLYFRPVLGGSLANPAQKYPRIFHHSFFKEFPYFLPSFAAALCAFVTAVVANLFLKEASASVLKAGAPHNSVT